MHRQNDHDSEDLARRNRDRLEQYDPGRRYAAALESIHFHCFMHAGYLKVRSSLGFSEISSTDSPRHVTTRCLVSNLWKDQLVLAPMKKLYAEGVLQRLLRGEQGQWIDVEGRPESVEVATTDGISSLRDLAKTEVKYAVVDADSVGSKIAFSVGFQDKQLSFRTATGITSMEHGLRCPRQSGYREKR